MSNFSVSRNNNRIVKKKLNNQDISIVNNNNSLASSYDIYEANINTLSLNNTVLNVDANEFNFLNSTEGIASASKALIADNNNNITGINQLSCNSININGTIIPSANNSSSASSYLTEIVPGIANNNKALVLNENKNISNIKTLSTNSINVNNYNITVNSNNNYNINNLSYNVLNNDNNWTSICWSNKLNLFAAVADSGNNRIMTSPDGITWTSITNIPNNDWKSICWSNELSLFIAVASSGINNRIIKSTDGITWNNNNIVYNDYNEPIINNKQFLYSNNNFSFYLILDDGTVKSWGKNDYGQLGDGTTTQRTSQVTVSGINNAIDISSGPSSNHSLALLNDKTVKSWGNNFYGQLGNTVNVGTNTANNIPYLIPDLNNVIMIKTGNNHSIALLSDGTIKCWGLNDRGQLGDGTTTNSSSPVTVSGINNAIAIAAGDKHSIALLSDGTIKSWGSNEFNQLGNSTNAGTTTANSSPLSVLNITNAIAIASGSNHCLALLNDNTVRAWGRNTDGQLGNGSTTSSFTPVTVTSLTSVIGISAGDVHSIALRTDGTIRIWGDGTSGKLGNGLTTDSTTIYNPSINGIAKYNLTSDTNYVNNNWTAICWNPDLEIFAAVSNTGTNNRIILSSNDSILSKETVIKNLNNSFNIDQNNDRIGLNISNPSYQLHLSSSNATKPGTSTWTVSSDIRLKENIEDADLDLCYNNIKNLPLKKYKWKDEYLTIENVPDRHKLGWIAQDVETILPKAIIINNQYDIEDCKSLDIDQIIATLYGSIKKLINICELQDSKITELENKKKILNDFINSLEIVQE